MKSKFEPIYKVFKENAIEINENGLKPYAAADAGNTNSYFKFQANSGVNYLLRLNGQLWSPFTRENESFNLTQLRESNISTNVLYNNPEQGFQISYLEEDVYRFTNLSNAVKNPTLFNNIGKAIRQFHDLKQFKNQFCLAAIITKSFSYIQDYDVQLLMRFLPVILSLIATLIDDTNNLISSHNDLLASSIYCKNNEINCVDWEYSGENHRSYDLAFFSIDARLTPVQEAALVNSYDSTDHYNTVYSVTMMKPVIDFLRLQWSMASKKSSPQLKKDKLKWLVRDLFNAEQLHVSRLKTIQASIGFFKPHLKTDEQIPEQKSLHARL